MLKEHRNVPFLTVTLFAPALNNLIIPNLSEFVSRIINNKKNDGHNVGHNVTSSKLSRSYVFAGMNARNATVWEGATTVVSFISRETDYNG